MISSSALLPSAPPIDVDVNKVKTALDRATQLSKRLPSLCPLFTSLDFRSLTKRASSWVGHINAAPCSPHATDLAATMKTILNEKSFSVLA